MSYRDVIDQETEGLFGNLKRNQFRGKPSQDKVRHEGQPATFVPFSFSGADVFDDTDTMDVFIYIPDEMVKIVKARAILFFRQFFASATTVSSGGGSTSGASSASTSGAGGGHSHEMFRYLDDIPGATTDRHFQARDGGGTALDATISTSPAASLFTYGSAAAHDHAMPHTHETPDHSHDLEYGVFKETLPASWSVELNLYRWTGVFWSLQHTITGLTDQLEEVDLSDYITTPGRYRIRLNSESGQPNDGRLGCDVAGHVVGAIQALSS